MKRLSLGSEEVEVLMDWMDKVRVGIWLGSVIYSEKPIKIKPHFGIATRPKKIDY